jgi:hypothetical protein
MKKESVKTAQKAAKKELAIEEITQLFKTFANAEKTAKESAEPYRKMILDYAVENQDEFDGKTLKLPNGVRVEIRVTEKASFNDDACTVEWLHRAITEGLGDAISVKIDNKVIGDFHTVPVQRLLKEIGYQTVEKESYAICLNS